MVMNKLSTMAKVAYLKYEHGAVQGLGQGLFPSFLCPPLISQGVMA